MNVIEIILRLIFVILNLGVMLGGILLIILGGVLISLSSTLIDTFSMLVSGVSGPSDINFMRFLNSAIILIVVGLVLVVVGLVGIIGTIKHKIFAFLLMGYMIVLGIIIVLQIVGVILAFIYNGAVIDAIRNTIGPQLITSYGENDTGVVTVVDLLQTRLKCCGINDTYRDYTSVNVSIPMSCSCVAPATCVTVMGVDSSLENGVTSAYALGCLTTAVNILENRTYQYVLGAIGIIFLVIEIAVLLYALCIIFMDFKGDV